MHGFIIFATLMGLSVAAPVTKKRVKPHKVTPATNNTEELGKRNAQDQEYFRYLDQAITVLEKDKDFKEKLGDAKPEDIASGKVGDQLDLLNHNIRNKLDEVKRKDVEHQRELLRQKKEHIIGIDGNRWNPTNSGETETVEREDVEKLLTKHNEVMQGADRKRREDFHLYEMEKEHKRRKVLKNNNVTKEEKTDNENKDEKNTHQRVHQPGHKAELEEVWEKQDGLDPESFDAKTLFKLHDKNDDGFLDSYELETFFLTDLDKVYNSSAEDYDGNERSEESSRMREYMMQSYDDNKDGLVSFEEFMNETNGEEFEKDDEWKSIGDGDEFTDKEMEEYEKMVGEDEDEGEDQDEDEDHSNKPEEESKEEEGERVEETEDHDAEEQHHEGEDEKEEKPHDEDTGEHEE